MPASLSKTPSGAGNQRTWTYSGWFKLCTTDQNVFLLSAGAYGDSKSMQFLIANSGNFLQFQGFSSGGSADFNCETNAELRDIGAWYHIMVACDTTQATDSNRAKIYINGELQTLRTATYPSQNYDTGVNTTIAHEINDRPGASLEQPLYGSHIHMADGNAYAATVFGETDATTGQWKIKTSPSVSYGTNGFFIMKDNGSGTDQSGQSNNWTANGTIINTQDNPSNVFATGNPLYFTNTAWTTSLSNGNNTFTGHTGSNSYPLVASTIAAPASGKFYAEFKVTSSSQNYYVGVATPEAVVGTAINAHYPNWDNEGGTNAHAYSYYGADGQKYVKTGGGATSASAYGSASSQNDILGVALDLDNNKLYIHKNGTYFDSGVPTSGSTGTGAISVTNHDYLFFMSDGGGGSDASGTANFGNGYFATTAISSEGTNASNIGKFEYDVPAGYTALSTKGLNE